MLCRERYAYNLVIIFLKLRWNILPKKKFSELNSSFILWKLLLELFIFRKLVAFSSHLLVVFY